MDIVGRRFAVEILMEFAPVLKFIVIHFIDAIHVIDADVSHKLHRLGT